MKESEKNEKNKLAVIVKESGLVEAKAKILLDNFSNYFAIAADWEQKARSIVVKDASQVAEMQMARTGRLFLQKKRVAIEHTRKQLKEQALREGKAIDGIANVLKALIIPIEDYLEQQEYFVEIQAAREAERLKLEAEKKAEEERIAREKAEAEERERIRLENERLKKEAEERERKIAIERAKTEAERKRREAERIAYEEKVQAEKEEAERKAREEREKQARIIAQQKVRAEAERKEREAERLAYEKKLQLEKKEREKEIAEANARVEAEKQKTEEENQRRIEAEKKAEREKEAIWKLKEQLANMIECPYCHRKFHLNQKKKKS